MIGWILVGVLLTHLFWAAVVWMADLIEIERDSDVVCRVCRGAGKVVGPSGVGGTCYCCDGSGVE